MDTTQRHDVLLALDELDRRRAELLQSITRADQTDRVQHEVYGAGYRGHGLGAVRDHLVISQHLPAQKARDLIATAEAEGHVVLLGSGSAKRVLDAQRHGEITARKEAAAERKANVIARLNAALPRVAEGRVAAVTVTYNGYLSIDTDTLERIADALDNAYQPQGV